MSRRISIQNRIKINIVLILVFALATFLRFYQLGQNPPSLNWDEVSNGYNAYSILKTGRDEYGNFLPLTFRAFGDYNPALSVYLLVPGIAIFGANEFAVRFPSAFLGTLTVLLTYFLTKKLFEKSVVSSQLSDVKGETIALVAMFLLAISPWHLQFSRYDHEANFMIFFSILGLVLLLYSRINFRLLIVSSIAFGLALNTYHGAKVWVPLFMIAALVSYRQIFLKNLTKLILPALILLIFSLPQIINLDQSTIRAKSTTIIGKEQSWPKVLVSGYLSHFSPNFLFVSGDNIGRHAIPHIGQLYVFELPLILIAIYSLISKKLPAKKFLLTWLLLAPIPASLAAPTPHALRAITFLPLWSILSSLGLTNIANSSLKSATKKILIFSILILALYNFVTYLHLYYKHYPKLTASDWQDGYKEMVEFVKANQLPYEKIAITNFYARPYIFVLFYSKFDPSLYQPQSLDKTKFDKYEFFAESWEKKVDGKVMVVRPSWQIPNPVPKYLKFIHATNGDLVFRISEE